MPGMRRAGPRRPAGMRRSAAVRSGPSGHGRRPELRQPLTVRDDRSRSFSRNSTRAQPPAPPALPSPARRSGRHSRPPQRVGRSPVTLHHCGGADLQVVGRDVVPAGCRKPRQAPRRRRPGAAGKHDEEQLANLARPRRLRPLDNATAGGRSDSCGCASGIRHARRRISRPARRSHPVHARRPRYRSDPHRRTGPGRIEAW